MPRRPIPPSLALPPCTRACTAPRHARSPRGPPSAQRLHSPRTAVRSAPLTAVRLRHAAQVRPARRRTQEVDRPVRAAPRPRPARRRRAVAGPPRRRRVGLLSVPRGLALASCTPSAHPALCPPLARRAGRRRTAKPGRGTRRHRHHRRDAGAQHGLVKVSALAHVVCILACSTPFRCTTCVASDHSIDRVCCRVCYVCGSTMYVQKQMCYEYNRKGPPQQRESRPKRSVLAFPST